MKHSFYSLTKVSKAYVDNFQRDLSMDFDNLFMWVVYTILGSIVLWLIVNRCTKFCRRQFKCDEEENVEVFLPGTCSTSSSFTYMGSVKPDYHLPHGVDDGLSDFDSNILFDQPMQLSNENPFCKQNAEKDQSSPEAQTSRSSSSVIGRRGPRDDDLECVHNKFKIFNESELNVDQPGNNDNEENDETHSLKEKKQGTPESRYGSSESNDSVVTQYSIDVETRSTFPKYEKLRKFNDAMHCEIVVHI